MADQVIGLAGAEGTAPAQEEQGLQQAGLAGGIVTVDEIGPGREIQLDGLKAPEIPQLEAGKHGEAPSGQNEKARPGLFLLGACGASPASPPRCRECGASLPRTQ